MIAEAPDLSDGSCETSRNVPYRTWLPTASTNTWTA